MLARKRHETIVESVQKGGSVRVRDLATLLDVSEMTVRRDIETLTAIGLIEKVHGGAVRLEPQSSDEPGFEAKLRRQKKEKAAIAKAAAAMVTPGCSVGLTAGTTTLALANRLVGVEGLTIVTNGPSVASALHSANRPDQTVVLTGGIRTPSDALVGPIATAALAALHLDLLFMGIHGMDANQGYTTPNLAEAETNRAFVHSARSTVVLADYTKWKTIGLARIAPLASATTVISDANLAEDAKDEFARLGVDLQLLEV